MEVIALKNKYSIIKLILGILVIILSISVLISNINSTQSMSNILICLGLFQIINGIDLYKHNKKIDGILLILCSMFIFFVVIKVKIL